MIKIFIKEGINSFKRQNKIKIPFLIFLLFAFSLIISVFSFAMNISNSINKISNWNRGINFTLNPFKYNDEIIDESDNNFRGSKLRIDDKNNQTYLYNFVNDKFNLNIKFESNYIKEFIEYTGLNSGYLDKDEKYEDIKNEITKNIIIGMYDNNILRYFLEEKLTNYFKQDIGFLIDRVGVFKNNYTNFEYIFKFAPLKNNIDIPYFANSNEANKLYIYKTLSNEELLKLNNNYIYVTPRFMKDNHLKVGQKYDLDLGSKNIETYIAGSAVMNTIYSGGVDNTSIYANIYFYMHNNLFQNKRFGYAYLTAENDLDRANKMNKFLNKYFINDDEHMFKKPEPTIEKHKGIDKKSAIYQEIIFPKIMYWTQAIVVSIFLLIIVFVVYVLIVRNDIKKKKEKLWIFKSNGLSNKWIATLNLSQEFFINLILFLIAIPLSMVFAKIFLDAISINIAIVFTSFINLKAVLIGIIIFILLFIISFIINVKVISKELNIQTKGIKITKFYNLTKKNIKPFPLKLGYSFAYLNFGKTIISLILFFITFLSISFGLQFAGSMSKTAKITQDYMRPYKNAVHQEITQDNDSKYHLNKKEYKELNNEHIFNYLLNGDNQELLKEINYLNKIDDIRFYFLKHEDIEHFMNIDIKENIVMDKIKNIQNELIDLQSQMKVNYDFDSMPDMYFKNYPNSNADSLYETILDEEIIEPINLVVLDETNDLYKDINVKNNEVIINEKMYNVLKDEDKITNNSFILKIRDKSINVKIKKVTNNILNANYIFINKEEYINNIDSNIWHNTYYSKDKPTLLNTVVLPVVSSQKGNKITDYIDQTFNLKLSIMDYDKLTKSIKNKAKPFSDLSLKMSILLFGIAIVIIFILLGLVIVENLKIMKLMKQLGSKPSLLINEIIGGYLSASVLAYVLSLVIVPIITKLISGNVSSVIGAKLIIGYDFLTVFVPLLIAVSFISLMYFMVYYTYSKINERT